MSLREQDVRAMMHLIQSGWEDTADPDQPLPWSVLGGLRSLVACDMVSFFRLNSRARLGSEGQELPEEPDHGLDPVFFEHYWDCAPCSYADRTGDLQWVVRVSDFYSLPQYHNTGMWSEYKRPSGFDRELVACVGGEPGHTVRVLLSRGPGLDFDERDRAVMSLLRPHLYELYRHRRRVRSPRTDLTPRQRELLRLVARGGTNRQIGRQLGISESTVRKHLEHVFERLKVGSRTAAVARAFPDGPPR